MIYVYAFFSFCLLNTPFLLSAKVDYEAKVFLTPSADCIVPKSLNQAGTFVGQITLNNRITDYLGDGVNDLVIIAHDTDPLTYPRLNNMGQVVGISQSDGVKQVYLYEPGKPLHFLGFPKGWDANKISIRGFNDKGQILVCNHENVRKATLFSLWEKEEFKELSFSAAFKLLAMNNHSDFLILEQGAVKGEMSLWLCDVKEGMQLIATRPSLFGYHLNDQKQVTFSDDSIEKTPGFRAPDKYFLWSPKKGAMLLGNDYPIGLNNKGDVLLRNYVGHTSNRTFSYLPFSVPLPDGAKVQNSSAHCFNDKGQIIALGTYLNEKEANLREKKQMLFFNPVKNSQGSTNPTEDDIQRATDLLIQQEANVPNVDLNFF